jgi:hypothetical protein
MPYHICSPNAARWDAFVRAHPDAHALQLSAWGAHQSRFGWQPLRIAVADESGALAAGAQVLVRSLPLGMGKRAYAPAAPLFSADEAANALLWQALRRCGAAFVKFEPCDWYRPRPDLPERLLRGRAAPFARDGTSGAHADRGFARQRGRYPEAHESVHAL